MERIDISASYASAEARFSGFDGFDDVDVSENETTEIKKAQAVKPYSIKVSNNTTLDRTVYLFGYSRFINTTNYGNGAQTVDGQQTVANRTVASGTYKTTVTPVDTNLEYIEFLSASASNPFETQLITLKAVDGTDASLPDVLDFIYHDIEGNVTESIFTADYLTEYAKKSGKVSIPVSKKIHTDVAISFVIPAAAQVIVNIYPSIKSSIGSIYGNQYADAKILVGEVAMGGRKKISGAYLEKVLNK